jgi:cytochrome oxidase assembly protein ShyY1
VTPLVLGDGSAVLVVRGWVPFRLQRAPVDDAAPPEDEVAVEGFLVPDEGDGTTVPDARGSVGRLDVRGIASSLPYDVFRLPLQLQRQRPRPEELPLTVPPPEISEGPHLSYAIQWFVFATIASLGGAILVRRERRYPRFRIASAAIST